MEKNEMRERIEDYKCLVQAMNEGGIPFYHKVCLTLDEAARYTGIGINKMRELCDQHPDLLFWNGTKRMVKRTKLEKYLENEYSI